MSQLVPGLEHAQLVGHSKGAFTGAVADLPGALERAHGGTLFLDEIALASPLVQGALLHLLEDGMVLRLGEQRPRRVDVRFVFATNADLAEAVRRGTFREDLLFRLGSFVVRLPPLREHRQDIPEMADAILASLSVRWDRSPPPLTPEAYQRLFAYHWPGNVRELRSAIEWYAVYGELPDTIRKPPAADWARLPEVLARNRGNLAAAARELGVTRQAVHQRLRTHPPPDDQIADVV